MSNEKMDRLNNIPEELRLLRQWVCWKLKTIDGKEKKIPIIPDTQNEADPTNPDSWSDFESALKWCQERQCDGIGFVFTEDDPYCGIDLDGCYDPDTKEIQPPALQILDQLKSYSEFSQSCKGIHIVVKARKSGDRCKSTEKKIEIYDHDRYFIMTGDILDGYPATIEECQSEVDSLYKSLFGEDDYNSKEDKPILEPPLPQSDEIIIQKASSAVNGNKFKGLMDGDISGYETESEADLALCTILAFWTDNEDQIYRIIQKSKLYDEKWERLDYRKMTIGKAIDSAYGRHSNKYSSKAMKGVDVETRKEFKRTDMGNAERLVYHNGENIRYCNELNKWFIWNGKFWETDKTLKIYQIAKETVRKICNESANHNDTNKIELIEHANKSESQTRINAMVTLARSESEIAVTANQLDIDKWLLNCQNGTIDLRTKELSCHNREDLITKIVPVDYDPLAQCPQWLKFLNEIFSGNQDLIKYIQAIIGYSLTGDTTEQCFFILYGTGQNGKSTLLDTILYIMGDYGKQANPETFEDRKRSGNAASEDIARLCGIRFVSTIETGHSSGLAENLIKKMSGDSKITARELYKSSTEFEQTHKLFIATNHKPKILGNDYGIWRRIKLIPFEVTIPECQRDNKLLSKLQLEASGILSWIIEGCMIWQQEGLSNLIPEKVRRAIEDYKAEMDNVNLFIQQKCIMESNAKIQTSMLYEAYEKWCLSNGWQPSNIQQFSNRLKDLLPNIDKKRSGNRGENMWHGLKLSYGGGSL